MLQIENLTQEIVKTMENLFDLQSENRKLSHNALSLARDIQYQNNRYRILAEYLPEASINLAQLQFQIEDQKSGVNVARQFTNAAAYPALSQIKAWAETNLKGRVLIHKNAFKNAASSTYAHPELVYMSLEMLANEFWEQKMSGSLSAENASAKRAAFANKLKELRLSVGGSVTTTNAKLRERYSATFDGERYFMDQHLGKGGGVGNPEGCLRIYFAWTDKRKAVLVGHLPDHLPTLQQ